MIRALNEDDELAYQRDREMGDGPEPGEQFGSAPVPPDELLRPSRSGKHVAARHVVQLPCSTEELAQFRAAAEDEDQPLGRWLVEAARAYRLMAMREDARLTDADWRAIARE